MKVKSSPLLFAIEAKVYPQEAIKQTWRMEDQEDPSFSSQTAMKVAG